MNAWQGGSDSGLVLYSSLLVMMGDQAGVGMGGNIPARDPSSLEDSFIHMVGPLIGLLSSSKWFRSPQLCVRVGRQRGRGRREAETNVSFQGNGSTDLTCAPGPCGTLWGTDGPKEALREGQGCLRPWFPPPVGFRLALLAQPGAPIPTFPSCLSPGAMAACARNTPCLGSTAVSCSPPLSLLLRPKSVSFWKRLAHSWLIAGRRLQAGMKS